jgi:hypothetical protein
MIYWLGIISLLLLEITAIKSNKLKTARKKNIAFQSVAMSVGTTGAMLFVRVTEEDAAIQDGQLTALRT